MSTDHKWLVFQDSQLILKGTSLDDVIKLCNDTYLGKVPKNIVIRCTDDEQNKIRHTGSIRKIQSAEFSH